MAFLLSLFQAVLIGLSGWMVAQATHISLSMPAMIVITLGIMFFSSTVPGLPMALGTFEFAAVSMLALWGVDRVMAFLLSLFQAVLIGLSGWMVAQATHISLSMPTMIVITLGITFFSSTVPGLPMALGTFEFAAVSMLALWGVDREQAIAFALILHAVLFVPPIIFAMFFLPREGLLSARELKSLTVRTRKEISSAGSTIGI